MPAGNACDVCHKPSNDYIQIIRWDWNEPVPINCKKLLAVSCYACFQESGKMTLLAGK